MKVHEFPLHGTGENSNMLALWLYRPVYAVDRPAASLVINAQDCGVTCFSNNHFVICAHMRSRYTRMGKWFRGFRWAADAGCLAGNVHGRDMGGPRTRFLIGGCSCWPVLAYGDELVVSGLFRNNGDGAVVTLAAWPKSPAGLVKAFYKCMYTKYLIRYTIRFTLQGGGRGSHCAHNAHQRAVQAAVGTIVRAEAG